MWGCATPATWNQGGCHQVPRLPRRSGAASRASRRRLNPAQGRHPGPSVPRLPRKTTVDVRLCHACHVKSRWMSPSATPAMCLCGCVLLWVVVCCCVLLCVCVRVCWCVVVCCCCVCVCWCVVVCCCVLLCVCCCVLCVCCCVLYCMLLYVCCMLWRRRREEEEKEKPGIQNQKQEPHTKMWGTTGDGVHHTFWKVVRVYGFAFTKLRTCTSAILTWTLQIDPELACLVRSRFWVLTVCSRGSHYSIITECVKSKGDDATTFGPASKGRWAP